MAVNGSSDDFAVGSVALAVNEVSKQFGGVQAVRDCSISIALGSIAGLIGPNGSGKTTLFNVVTGYLAPDAGRVVLFGQDITGMGPRQIFSKGLGRTFQLTRVFDRLTVLENMLVSARPDERMIRGLMRSASSAAERGRAMEVLDFVGLGSMPKMLAGNLSYGQRKLLELAYVFVSEPKLVLLDEPAGGVNLSLIGEISRRIAELNRAGTTFLIVEHNMEFVMGLCHQVTVMQDGTTIATDTPQAVRADPRVLDAYLGGDAE